MDSTPRLSGKQRAELRRRGQKLPVIVTIGQAGVTAGVGAALEQALFDHELVKVRVDTDDRDVYRRTVDRLATNHHAELVGKIGRTALLYRESPQVEESDVEQGRRGDRRPARSSGRTAVDHP
jgi:RNA-binding protein